MYSVAELLGGFGSRKIFFLRIVALMLPNPPVLFCPPSPFGRKISDKQNELILNSTPFFIGKCPAGAGDAQ